MAEEVALLNVEGMTCTHCAESIENAVGSLNGVVEVSVSVADGKVSVEYDNERVNIDTIRDIIEDQGYEVK